MEELAEINFIAAMEGQEIERTMSKMVSKHYLLLSDALLHVRMLKI